MVRRLIPIFCAIIALPGLAADDNPTTMASQLFECKLNPGKTVDNIWSVMETWANVPRTSGDDPSFGKFLWLPFRSSSEYDYAFGLTSSDLVAAAEGSTRYAASDNSRTMAPLFRELGTCDATISTSTKTYGGEGIVSGKGRDRTLDAMVDDYRCKVNPGSTIADVDKAIEYWQAQLPKIGSPELASYEAFYGKPVVSQHDWDLNFVAHTPNFVSWAKLASDYFGSKAGQAASERLAKVSTCRNSLWRGYWLVAPGE